MLLDLRAHEIPQATPTHRMGAVVHRRSVILRLFVETDAAVKRVLRAASEFCCLPMKLLVFRIVLVLELIGDGQRSGGNFELLKLQSLG